MGHYIRRRPHPTATVKQCTCAQKCQRGNNRLGNAGWGAKAELQLTNILAAT